jgi:hypothetical protein
MTEGHVQKISQDVHCTGFVGYPQFFLRRFTSTRVTPTPNGIGKPSTPQRLNFPNGFCGGAATSAYQIEGDLTNNNWYVWERTKQANGRDRIMRGEVAGKAANHYKLYKEDVKLIADFGLNAYRFSIEWSRIEPPRGASLISRRLNNTAISFAS